MLVELSLNNLIDLFKLSSIGKLINGLVHNLNGPLQNFCMDMEMMNHSLMGNGRLHDDLVKNLRTRLKRMEEEFERIDHLIKTSSIRSNLDEDQYKYMDINEFLNQELLFLKSNLYFKHNVHTELQFQDTLSRLSNLPEDFQLAINFFMQAIIEELENQEIKKLILKTSFVHSDLELIIATEEGNLSSRFMETLKLDITSSQRLKIEDSDVGIILALAILKTGGVSIAWKDEPSGSIITLHIPTHNPLS